MAVATSRVRIQQHGNAMVGQRVDNVYDEKTGMIGQKKTTIASVPMQGGGTAYMVGEEYTAAQLAPQYSARRSYQPAIQYNEYEPVASDKKEKLSYNMCFWLLCGCLTFNVSLGVIISIGATHIVTCFPLQEAGVTGLILGAIGLLISCICCSFVWKNWLSKGLANHICCLVVTLLVLVFLGFLIANTVYIAQNSEFVFSNGSYVHANTTLRCSTPAIPFGVMITSYVMFVMFGLFCAIFSCSCFLNVFVTDTTR